MRRVSKPFKGKRTVVDGFTFDSKLEARRYGELKILETAGELTELVVHPKIALEVNGTRIGRGYVVYDFQYRDADGRLVIEDVKAVDTREARLRRLLVAAIHGVDVVLVGKRGR